jgi:DNA-binding LacI/PurR family transcriptional regulator
MGETRSVTIADAVALTEVSIGPVSKALNGRGQLRAETCERVP